MTTKLTENTFHIGTVHQLNVKKHINGERGIPKHKIDALSASHTGANGDYNHHRHTKDNNNPNRALLILPLETIESLRSEGWPVKPGDLGENITSSGIPYSDFQVGLRLKVRSVIFERSEENAPCTVLQNLPYVGTDKVDNFVRALIGRRGWYASVVEAGEIRAGDSIHTLK